MTAARQLTIVLSIVTLASCRDASTAPDQTTSDGFPVSVGMIPVSSRLAVTSPGNEPRDLPAVKLYDVNHDKKPVAGRKVTFTVRGVDGGIWRTESVMTGNDGIARISSWRVGNEPGRYEVSAAVPDLFSQSFAVYVLGRVAAIYDLQNLDHVSRMYETPIAEGHLVLYESGAFTVLYGRPFDFTSPVNVIGSYRQTSDRYIAFYVEPSVNGPDSFYYTQSYVYATGSVAGRALTMNYTNTTDFTTEEYLLR